MHATGHRPDRWIGLKKKDLSQQISNGEARLMQTSAHLAIAEALDFHCDG